MNNNKIIFLFLITFMHASYCNESIDLYFCTAANSKYFNNLLNLIGSIHKTNFDNLREIAVFNIGLSTEELEKLNTIQKVKTYEVELTHPDLLKPFKTTLCGKEVPGWYAWKPVILKQSLEMFPYVLYIDAGLGVLRPLDNLFKYIQQNKYFLGRLRPHSVWRQTNQYLYEKFELRKPENEWVIFQDPIVGFIIGASRQAKDILINPFYEFTKDITNFQDDGTCPGGFGDYRHDQSLLSVYGHLNRLWTHRLGCENNTPILLNIENKTEDFYFHIDIPLVNEKTHIYYSARFDERHNKYAEFIKFVS
ncbi:MAG: hypothetical protein P4L22_00400 [Candidatus Babeliales bacterium]|nr:hypothetical protein [Candidatus Babeliales bacterium]